MRRGGFTLIEMLVALVVVSLVLLIGLPKFTEAMTAQNLRGSRTTVVNMLAKARAASTETNRLTWLKVGGNKAWILARPRTDGAVGADTLGVVEDLSKRYGTTVAMSRDSIGFDPRGIASELGGAPVTLTVSKSSHSEVVTIDAMGRVVK
jgi:prepilin-type N-terminal cleavage/methylation domain-containing protein